MKQETVDVLIIGAGPSGTVAAAYLQQHGIKVKVVEKSKFPRFSIGESLLPRCMDHFEEVGLLDCLKARGYEEKHGARFIKGDSVCHFHFNDKFTEGYSWTWQVPRDDFDNTLAQEIIKRGVDVCFEEGVTDVKFEAHQSKVHIENKLGEKSIVNAEFIIDASGNGRVIPRILGLEQPVPMPKNTSIFTQIKDINRPKSPDGTLITFDILETDVWLWIIPFSNGITSIGVVGANEYIDSFKGSSTEKLKKIFQQSDYYANRFKGIEYLFSPFQFKNTAKSVKQLYGKGYAITGNSAAFIDPVFSSGVSFATESGLLAAKLVTRELNKEKVDWEKEYSQYLKKGSAVFASYIKEWYTGNLQKLFFHQPANPEIKRQICAILAGYTWDETNPFVRKHDRLIKTLAHLIDM